MSRTDPVSGTESEVMAIGLACSEVFSGHRLAQLLRPGFNYEREVLGQLEADCPAQALSIHTSAGVPPALSQLIVALGESLPWADFTETGAAVPPDDWCVSLQVEGTSAVLAATDLLMQLQHPADGYRLDPSIFTSQRTKVAVSEFSYHGPASSSYGSNAPLGVKANQVCYPMPAFPKQKPEETDAQFHERMTSEFDAFLEEHGDTTAVMLVEPQSGSSLSAQPWPKQMLKDVIRKAQGRGILVCADEVMCGLGRHGNQGIFLSESWGLEPDAVTFGKAVGGGVFPLSGAILRRGAKRLSAEKRSVMQSHTYSGSSVRALMTAHEVLREVPKWQGHIQSVERYFADTLRPLIGEASGGTMFLQGHGLMWGGAWAHSTGLLASVAERKRANNVLRRVFLEEGVLPYMVNYGFMVTPTLDIELHHMEEAGQRLARAVSRASVELGLKPRVNSIMAEERIQKVDAAC